APALRCNAWSWVVTLRYLLYKVKHFGDGRVIAASGAQIWRTSDARLSYGTFCRPAASSDTGRHVHRAQPAENPGLHPSRDCAILHATRLSRMVRVCGGFCGIGSGRAPHSRHSDPVGFACDHSDPDRRGQRSLAEWPGIFHARRGLGISGVLGSRDGGPGLARRGRVCFEALGRDPGRPSSLKQEVSKVPQRLSPICVSQGAPTLVLEDHPARHFLATLGKEIGRPEAILCVSAHWETAEPTVSTAERPETIHDFYGFPEQLYRLRYPAPGAPDLARRAAGLLRGAGFTCNEDPARGLDHGAWSPLILIYPEADIPVT